MELLLTLMFLVIILVFVFFGGDRSDKFSPRNIIPLVYLVKIIPSMLYISINEQVQISKSILINIAVNSQGSFMKHGLLQIVSFIGMMLVINLICTKKRITSEEIEDLSFNDMNNYRHGKSIRFKGWGVFFFLIGFTAFVINIQSIGGINYFLNNLQYRTILLRDQDLLVWLSSFIVYAPLLFIYSKKYEESNKKISWVMWGLIIVIGLISGLGGRKDILFLIINVLMLYNYSVQKLNMKKFFNPKNIIIIVIVIFLFGLLPLLRTQGQLEAFITNPAEMMLSVISNVWMLIVNESYVPYYITTVGYFNSSNMWYGRGFLGLLTAFIPSSIYPQKPPVDDGMYLYSIFQGRTDILPVMAVPELNLSSYPLETFGSMYANFGFIGVIIGMLLLGYIISKAYIYMKKRNGDIYSILLYSNILLNFELSTLRIVQLIITAFLVYVVSFTSERVRFFKRVINNFS